MDKKIIQRAMEESPILRNFIESGDSKRVSVLLSMGYLVQSVANAYNEEAIEIMEKHGLVHKKIKTKINNLIQSFDAYDKAVFSLIDSKEARENLLEDYDTFRGLCDKFMNADVRKAGRFSKTDALEKIYSIQDKVSMGIFPEGENVVMGILTGIAKIIAEIDSL